MKHWLIWLYPHAWRRRYGDEFRALLEQQTLTVQDVFDIVRGAVDAHCTVFSTKQQEVIMMTFTVRVHRRTLYIFAAMLLAYLTSYSVCRTSGLLVHSSQNRYTGVSLHDVKVSSNFANPYAPLAVLFAPLRIAESVTWPVVDTVASS